MNEDIMKLEIWRGDWGLPSVDVECLQVWCLAKLSNIPLKVNSTNNPFWSHKGTLPIFRHNDIVLNSFTDIKKYFESQNMKADSHLNRKELGEINAYYNLLQQKLHPALQYIWWIDEQNYVEVFRKWYAKALPFPLNYFYPGRYERSARKFFEAMYPDEYNNEIIQTNVYGDAEKCISNLSVRLNESEYFFGTKPSSLDALVYGFLAPLLNAPLKTANLQNHLKACTNLVRFVDRITHKYFPDVKAYETKSVPNKTKKTDDEEFPHATRNKFFAGLFATSAMLGWAFLHGFIPVPALDPTINFDEDDFQPPEENS